MAVLTEEQSMLRDAGKSWVQEKSPVTAFRKMRDSGAELGYDVAAWNEMAEMGWAGVIIPEEYGGSNFGYLSLGLVLEELGRTLTDVVNVEHEEVLLVPRWVKAKRVTFKYGLGDQFIGVMKTLHMLGLDNKEKINVKGVQVAPRDVVAACLPDPAHLGEKMHGKTCAGTWVKGVKAGQPREVYLYQVADNQQCMEQWGCQASCRADGVQRGHRDGPARTRLVEGSRGAWSRGL